MFGKSSFTGGKGREMSSRDRRHDFDQPVERKVATNKRATAQKDDILEKLDKIRESLGQAQAQPGNTEDWAQKLRDLGQAKTTYVVAGNMDQFREWAKRTSTKNYQFVTGPETFQRTSGISGGQVVFYGTWYARPDIVDVKQAIAMASEGYGGMKMGPKR